MYNQYLNKRFQCFNYNNAIMTYNKLYFKFNKFVLRMRFVECILFIFIVLPSRKDNI